ncbi:Proline-rich receptor-like protein kinase PERK12 [Camellia lanceoleosa]|uniref:Proline-rich receptor-like protein kinase PERK12 n=1 Tax=Camellia lanceoleosa TaxID=1840588 RepID=A0ACC0IRD6_9ERIC|nr:Proline-rich receptor-like protein kinase PERK12 [Camellia lanceoleosa]
MVAVMMRCFARDQSCQLCKTQYNVTLASGDRDIVAHKTLPLRVSETSSSKQSNDEGLISPHESHFHFNFPNSKIKSQPFLPYHASTSKQGENHPTMSESSSQNKTLSDDHNISSAEFSKVNLVMRMPLQLSWEMVKEITGGFTRMTCFEENENFKTYCGYLNDHHSQFLKAALSMHHKNILGLSGYYKGKNGTVLGKQWTKMTFQEKIRIAIGIGEGVRYMHEECPRGPVVHGDLRQCNIFLNFDLEPQITSFGNATWLHLKQGLPISSNRFWHTDPSDLESLALLKSDIIHFGILLLRLFCRRFAPQDGKIFVDWARPLLLQRAFHKLLDEDMEDLDVYGIFTVTCVAAQCINTKPISRSSLSSFIMAYYISFMHLQIISVLNGETSCAMQLSPSSEGSPNINFSGSSIGRLVCNLILELSLSK